MRIAVVVIGSKAHRSQLSFVTSTTCFTDTGFGKEVENAGGKLLSQYWSVGEAGGCVVFEAADEQTGAALLLGLAKDGNIRTRTMRLYDNQAFQQVLSNM